MYNYDTYAHIGMNGNQISIESVRRSTFKSNESHFGKRIWFYQYKIVVVFFFFFSLVWFVCFSIKYLLIVFVGKCVIVRTEPFERSSRVMIVKDNVLVNGMSNGRWVIIIKSNQIVWSFDALPMLRHWPIGSF